MLARNITALCSLFKVFSLCGDLFLDLSKLGIDLYRNEVGKRKKRVASAQVLVTYRPCP